MTETSQPCVVFAGTSASVRETLERVAALRGIRVHGPVSVNDCRRLLDRHGGALLVTELNGDAAVLHSMAKVKRRHPKVPVLAIVDRGDIPATVQAMRAGVANCLEKPVDPELLTSAINEALDQVNARPSNAVTQLTPVETAVLELILQGRTNRQIAETMHRSPRTIEVHRRHIMRKLGVSTIVDLIRAASARGLGPMKDISTEESV